MVKPRESVSNHTLRKLGVKRENFAKLLAFRHKLGSGSSAIVQRAICLSNRLPRHGYAGLKVGRDYAVKSISFSYMSSVESGREKLKAELDVLCRLQQSASSCSQGQYFVKLYHALYDTSSAYLVMEVLDGGTLADRVLGSSSSSAALSESEIASITRKLVEALDYLHRVVGYVHLDVKPENIMFASGGYLGEFRLKLIDFSYAQSLTSGGGGGRDRTRNSCSGSYHKSFALPLPTDALVIEPRGTPHFMAPELVQYFACREVYGDGCTQRVHRTNSTDAQRLDMFSVGVVAYFMLSRGTQRPYMGETACQLIRSYEWSGYKPLNNSSSSSTVSCEAQRFCAELLRKNRNPRPLAEECLKHPWLASNTATAARRSAAA